MSQESPGSLALLRKLLYQMKITNKCLLMMNKLILCPTKKNILVVTNSVPHSKGYGQIRPHPVYLFWDA